MIRRGIGMRLLQGAVLVLGVVTATFVLINLAPGDPARLWAGPAAGALELQAAREALGLDRPLPVRYADWLRAFVTGDWGISISQQRPVAAVIGSALPHTLLLAGSSILLTWLGGIVVGLVQAHRAGSAVDTGLTISSLVIHGMPAYWLAIVIVMLFSFLPASLGAPVWLRFPALGASSLQADFLNPLQAVADRLRHLTLPLLTLTLIGVAASSRYVRSAVLEVRKLDHVRAARGRGLPERTVQFRHVLRNALLPVITLLGLSLPALFSGAVFVEVIFAWPGMGRVIVTAVSARDYPVIMATTAVFAGLVVLGNMLADALYRVADPRTAA